MSGLGAMRRRTELWLAWAMSVGVILAAAAPVAAQATPPPEPVERGTVEVGDGKPKASEKSKKAAPEVKDERVRISFDVEDAKGGGRAEVFAEDVRYQPDEYFIAENGVEIRYKDLVLTADRARLDIPTNLLTAEGRVILDEGPQRMTGDTLEYNLGTRTGRLSNADAFVSPDFYFSGDELAKLGDTQFSITEGTFTSCSQEVPSWSIALSSAKITIDEYARIRNARVRFKRLPVLYVPYLLWPANTDRSSGFLVPRPGYSNRRGAHLGLAYFQTLGRSTDLTYFAEGYSRGFYGGGLEFRYRPSERSKGALQAYLITEPTFAVEEDRADGRRQLDPSRMPGDDRWKIQYYHETNDIWKHFKGVVQFQDYSDFDYLSDYEREVQRNTLAFVYSKAYLSGNIGPHSLNFLVDQKEFLPVRETNGTPGDTSDDTFQTDRRRQMPEIEYRLRATKLGSTPIYVSLLSSLNSFTLERTFLGEDFSFDYERADLLPLIQVPLSTLPWLSAKLNVGGRITHYTKQLNAERTDFVDQSLTRAVPLASLQVVGPSISRVFEKGLGRFEKFKHIVEPRWDFVFTDEYEEQLLVPFYDEVDDLRPRQDVVFSLINRLIAKPAPKKKDGTEDEEPANEERATANPLDGPVDLPVEADLLDRLENGAEGEAVATVADAAVADGSDADDSETAESGTPPEPDVEAEGAFEIMSFTLARAYSFDDQRPGLFSRTTVPDPTPEDPNRRRPEFSSSFGPILAGFRYNPSRRTSVRVDATYNTLFRALEETRVSGTFGWGKENLIGLSYLEREDTERTVTTKSQAQLGTRLGLMRDRLYFDATYRVDLNAIDPNDSANRTTRTLAQSFGLTWRGACLTAQLEWRESFFSNVRDTDLRFLITLKNVGTFIDLNGNTNAF